MEGILMLGMKGTLMLDMKGTLMLDMKGTLMLVSKGDAVMDPWWESRGGEKRLVSKIGRLVVRKNRGGSQASWEIAPRDMVVETVVGRTFHGCLPNRKLYCDPKRHAADPCKGYANTLAEQARNNSVVCGRVSTVVVAILA
jgi:hypothetical protein